MEKLGKTFIDIINSISIIGVYIYQEEGKIVFSNEAFANLLGYDKDEILKLTVFDILYKDKDYIKSIIEKRTRGETFTKEYNELFYKTKSGFIKPTINFGYTITFNGKPAGLVIVIDSTQQKLFSILYESLAKIMFIATSSKNEKELIKKTVNTLVETVGFDLVVVGKIDEKTKLFELHHIKAKLKEYEEIFKQMKVSADENIPEGKGSIGEAYRTKSIVVINNIYKDDRMKAWREQQKKTGVYAVCSLPVGDYIMALYSRIPEIFDEQHIKLIKNIQTAISAAIKRINLERWKNLLNSTIEQGFDLVIITDKELNILYLNSNTERITGFSKEELEGKKLDFLLTEKVKQKPINTINGGFYRVVLCKRKDGTQIDILLNISKTIEEDQIFYIATGKDITGNIELQKAIDETLNKDQIIGLLNRNAFVKAIEKFIHRAKHKNLIGAVVVINPIEFSTINKALGFKKANSILKQIAERLINFLREYDTVAKLESDRFGVLIKDIQREEDVFVIVKRLLDVLFKPYSTGSSSIIMGFNAGISMFPSDSKDAEELIEKAEIAIPESKEKSVNLGFYRDSLKEKFTKRVQIESSFLKALENDEFVFFLQPYVNANDLSIGGAEALIRWKKNGKIISPMEFVPILEEMKLIKDLEIWTVNKKLPCLKNIIEKGIPIALNISPVSLNDDLFVEKLINSVKENGINPKMLRIEITERLFIENLQKAAKTLNKLRNKGFKIMVDDFGTGYSSLSYISKLPLDFIKIDISFTRIILNDAKTLSIVKTILFMAKELGIKTVAEGVETKEQANLLKQIGCDYLQGFLFYKPMPAEELVKLIR
ncbi:EAL domain-containing protein [Hippea alviniae]|uniref:EAL domain-containing protein n=1 Tax=Hippea alviniae TaxID=1279027 RepID=UPI0003B56CC7|nr:EAL domain-containing protein [Hippea alviniae]